MKIRSLLLSGIVAAAVCAGTDVRAQVELADGTTLSAEPYFVVTYIETAPATAHEAADLIKDFSAASQSDDGVLRFEALRRVGRGNHFLILEAWQNQAAREAHAAADRTVAFRNALQSYLYNPYDERPHVGLVAADPTSYAAGNRTTLYVVTHVDIIPPEQFPPCKRQVSEDGPCGNALVEKLVGDSRGHEGNIRFDALTQANRPNHMTVVEMWETPGAQENHTISDEVKAFRDELSAIPAGSGVNADPLFVLNPMTGSLYDERLYKVLE